MKRLLAPLFAVFAVLLIAAPAQAAPVDDAIGHLSSSHPVYRADGAQVTLSSDAAAGAPIPLAVAALPASTTAPSELAQQIGQATFTQTRGVVIVIAGVKSGFYTNYSGSQRQAIDNAGRQALADHPLKANGDATPFIKDFVQRMQAVVNNGNSSGGGTSGTATSAHSGRNTAIVVGVIAAIAVIGFGLWHRSNQRKTRQRLAGRRAEVVSLYDRLGADVINLDAKGDPVTEQAIADASERYTAAGSQLEQADSDMKYDTARRTVLEGLQAARTARKRLGLDLGPDLPPMDPTAGEALTEKQELKVGDRTVQAYPDYTPGAPYYYRGGGGYGAGWYSFPFWETMLIGSMLGGGFGFGGGGFGSGYDRGFDAGYDQGQQNSGNWGSGGNDWGGGGGNWGSGGNDWGGGGGSWGGGGDWGGGGGDWGGGGGGGGW